MTHLRIAATMLALVATASPLGGQTPAPPGPAPDRSVITGERLRSVGAPTVYDAIHRLRPVWLSYRHDTGYHALYVDSVLVPEGLETLRGMDPSIVQWVQYSSGAEARRRFGPTEMNGVIHVSTRLPLTAVAAREAPLPALQDRPGISLGTGAVVPIGGPYFDGMTSQVGFTAAGSLPLSGRSALTLTLQHGQLSGGHSPTHPQDEQQSSVTTVDAGLKVHGGRSRIVAPYLNVGMGVYHVDWKYEYTSNEALYNDANGVGMQLAAGIDLHALAAALVFVEGSVSLVRLERDKAANMGGLRTGVTVLLGHSRAGRSGR